MEFKRLYLGYRPELGSLPMSRPVKHCAEDVSPNADIDWRSHGAVTAVKDQGQCGSCWAFSAVESVESAWFLSKGTLPILSPQQVVSCDTKTGDEGCNGGWPEWAYEYIEKAGGLTTEALYPYTSGTSGETGKCKVRLPAPVASISNFVFATPPCNDTCKNQDEATLLKTLSTGPVSICVDAQAWSAYIGGIMSSSCSSAYDNIDHCVQLVGYSGSGVTPYWIVRNSWNTNWGEDGFMYLKYGQNLCGLADQATVPVV
jgi:C1A family cysteine protease